MSYPDSSDPYRTDRPPSDTLLRSSGRPGRSLPIGPRCSQRTPSGAAAMPRPTRMHRTTGQPGARRHGRQLLGPSDLRPAGARPGRHPTGGRDARRPRMRRSQPPSGARRSGGHRGGPPYPARPWPRRARPRRPAWLRRTWPPVAVPPAPGGPGPRPAHPVGPTETGRLRGRSTAPNCTPLDLDLTGQPHRRALGSRRRAEAGADARTAREEPSRPQPADGDRRRRAAGRHRARLAVPVAAGVRRGDRGRRRGRCLGDGHAVGRRAPRRRAPPAAQSAAAVDPADRRCLVMPRRWPGIGGVESLVLGLLVTVVAVMVWRLSAAPAGFRGT